MDYSLLLGFHFLENCTSEPASDNNNQDVPKETINNSQSINIDIDNLSDHELALRYLKTQGILSADGTEIYFIGVIDILQKYDCSKKTERCFKIYCLQADKVSNENSSALTSNRMVYQFNQMTYTAIDS